MPLFGRQKEQFHYETTQNSCQNIFPSTADSQLAMLPRWLEILARTKCGFALPAFQFALCILIFSLFLILQNHPPCGLKLLSIGVFFFSIFTSDLFDSKNFHTREFPLHLHLIYPFKDIMSSLTDPLYGSCKVIPLFSLRHIIGSKQVFFNQMGTHEIGLYAALSIYSIRAHLIKQVLLKVYQLFSK